MDFTPYNYSSKALKDIYKGLIYPRLIEEKMLKLLRQGQVSKWFSGIGQEAIAVGATMALEEDEFILPLHRNLGVFTSRGISFDELLLQWRGHENGFTQGRDRSFHFGSIPHHIVGMISHLGAMLSVADGIALAHQLNKRKKVSLAFTGEGGTSEGEFHEALNLAAVWDLPVIFLVEHNGYGLSTPSKDQFRCENVADKGIGYGIESKIIDGNNVLEVHSTIKAIAKDLRKKPRPFLLECKTFRMRGHEEASGTKYVPQELLDQWARKDPISNFEEFLFADEKLKQELNAYKQELKSSIDASAKSLLERYTLSPDIDKEIAEVYAPHQHVVSVPSSSTKEIRFIDAIAEGMDLAMETHPELVLMGQDIAEYGGVFKITDGLTAKYGKDRVRNTPISEAAPLGAALGMSIGGMKTMVEMQFADFVSCGFNQIANNLAKTYYRWGQNSDVVIRMPTGAGSAAGPFHSQSNEGWFFQIPGLKIVYPSSPAEAKGLLLESFNDPNPVLFFEHKYLYRNISGEVPEGYYTLPLGKARSVQEGEDITFISYGWAVHWCTEIADKLGLNATILDLQTLLPWDKDAVRQAVAASGKVIVVQEDSQTGGIASEIASWIGENCFEMLDAPVKRVGSLDTPIPFNAELEQAYLGKSRLEKAVQELLDY